jgi:glycosyltransferase involved in cell wall biosynthesis
MHAPAKFLFQHAGADLAGLETIHDNPLWPLSRPRLSIVVAAGQSDASPLIRELARCRRALETEIVIYDDGSRNTEQLAAMQRAADNVLPPIRIVAAWAQCGRAAARNRALAHARSAWILLLDGALAPDDESFLAAYLALIDAAAEPAIIVGGLSLAQEPADPRFALHHWDAERTDALSAAERTATPGRSVFSSNVLVHRDVLAACPFDDALAGADDDDSLANADWSLRVAATFPVRHIDNPVTPLALDADDALIMRHGRAGAGLAQLALRHPAEVNALAIHRAATRAQRLPFRPALKSMSRAVACTRALPVGLRGRALNLWRALGYAERL